MPMTDTAALAGATVDGDNATGLVRRARPKIATDATQLIGNTPLLELSRFAPNTPARLLGKLDDRRAHSLRAQRSSVTRDDQNRRESPCARPRDHY